MTRIAGLVAAALGGAVIAVFGSGVLASVAGGAGSALVTLQVAPRGPGTVSASPAAVNDKSPCSGQSGPIDCQWQFDRGTTVKLTAAAAGAGASFAGWSDPDCGSASSCTVKLDDDLTSVVARFSPLMLGVVFSNDNASKATVSFDPPGQPCANPPGSAHFCREYAAGTRVTLTAQPGTKPFTAWNENGDGAECLPVNAPTCTITVVDQPTWAGARFGTEPAPGLAGTIKVEFKLLKGGNGGGRVTATKLDCGNACSASFGYGRAVTVTAKPEDGSLFDGWNGVCARTDTTCTLAVGPITFVRASFVRDTVPPSAPGSLTVPRATRSSITIAWTASTDNLGVKGYRVYLDSVTAGEANEPGYTIEGLKCGRGYVVAVDAADGNGNRSGRATVDARTGACAFAARLAGLAVETAPGARIVVAQVRVNNPAPVRLELRCGSRSVASRSYSARPGTNRLRLSVPSGVPAGPCRLAVSLVDPAGPPIALAPRGVLLPKRR